jgi:DNA polymerase
MSLDLDKRQRAMLREMGVRVWQPMAAPASVVAPAALAAALPEPVATPQAAHTPVAIDSVAADARHSSVASTFQSKPAASGLPESPPEGATAGWSMGQAQALYGDAPAGGARWLVLAEMPAAALNGQDFNPFVGDTGKLLDNMLRATRLHQAGVVMLAPLLRRMGADAAATSSLAAELTAVLAVARPDIVLIMGRMAAQALLQSSEAFGKLRGQVHQLQGIRAVATHDAAYLLRTPLDKAGAWDDLCLAMSVAAAPAS